MCRVLEVSRSGYYKWLKNRSNTPSDFEKRKQIILDLIKRLFHDSLGTYGAPRIHKDLLAAGYKVSIRTVGRYMRELGLRAFPKAPYTVTTDSDHAHPVYDNLLTQQFETDAPNKVWVSDITYIWTEEGWVYLATVLDLYSRKIVGWNMADNMRTDLPLMALKKAITTRQPQAGLIHHSDRGSQYASSQYRETLDSIQASGSMSRTGNPYDNACAESFFATLKKEFVNPRKFKTRKEAIQRINWYIGHFYNEKRRHSRNDYLSPNQFERGETELSEESLISFLLARE